MPVHLKLNCITLKKNVKVKSFCSDAGMLDSIL